MAENEAPKKSLLDWLGEFYEDTGTLSGIIRYLAFAGIGLIWIFRNSDLTQNILPKDLLLPLKFIILCLIADVLQYLWRAITIYINYKIKHLRYTKGKQKNAKISNVTLSRDINIGNCFFLEIQSDAEISDVTMPHYISIGSWIFFGLKIIFIPIAYILIYNFITGRL